MCDQRQRPFPLEQRLASADMKRWAHSPGVHINHDSYMAHWGWPNPTWICGSCSGGALEDVALGVVGRDLGSAGARLDGGPGRASLVVAAQISHLHIIDISQF
jgi:hypothetical protein